MVFGFFEGKIELITDKTNYAKGETINGKIILDLKKEKQAKELRLLFMGERVVRSTRMTPKGVSSSTQRIPIHRFETVIDGDKIYPVGKTEYSFSIQIPSQSSQQQMPGGAFGSVLKIAEALSGAGGRIEWSLQASLNVPASADVTKRIQVNIVE